MKNYGKILPRTNVRRKKYIITPVQTMKCPSKISLIENSWFIPVKKNKISTRETLNSTREKISKSAREDLEKKFYGDEKVLRGKK